jgi:hypothetical protein
MRRVVHLLTKPSRDTSDNPQESLSYFEQSRKLCRSLFWTKKGYIGHNNSRPSGGDLVVIFDGDTTPSILRKVEAEDGAEMYKIVCDCYDYGWMYGMEKTQL